MRPLAIALALGLATAPKLSSAEDQIVRVQWLQRPTSGCPTAFPLRESRIPVDGQVKMLCALRADGTLGQCDLLSESPIGYGLGREAQQLAKCFRAAPTTLDGQPLSPGMKVLVPMKFNHPIDHPVWPPAPPPHP